MFSWLFGKNYEIEIADLNKTIGDLQKKLDNLETRLEDLNIEGEVEDAIERTDFECIAENAIEEAFNRIQVRF